MSAPDSPHFGVQNQETSEHSREPLTYAELVNINTGRILFPENIPVHPLVYQSDFAYSTDFVASVKAAIPASIKEDVDAIETALGIQLGISIEDGLPVQGQDKMERYALTVKPDSTRRFVEVSYGASTNIAVDTRPGYLRRLEPLASHPMSREKLQTYSLEQERIIIPSWYIHNLSDNGFKVALYLRNFAIVFNNLGLSKI